MKKQVLLVVGLIFVNFSIIVSKNEYSTHSKYDGVIEEVKKGDSLDAYNAEIANRCQKACKAIGEKHRENLSWEANRDGEAYRPGGNKSICACQENTVPLKIKSPYEACKERLPKNVRPEDSTTVFHPCIQEHCLAKCNIPGFGWTPYDKVDGITVGGIFLKQDNMYEGMHYSCRCGRTGYTQANVYTLQPNTGKDGKTYCNQCPAICANHKSTLEGLKGKQLEPVTNKNGSVVCSVNSCLCKPVLTK